VEKSIDSSDPSLQKCSKCAELIQLEAIKCRYCGSSLLPTFDHKIRAYLRNPKNRTPLIILLIIIITVTGFGIHQINLSKEMAALRSTGQVCVYGDETKAKNFGCSHYPKLKFDFCTTAEVIRPYWSDGKNYPTFFSTTGDTSGRITGVHGEGCYDPLPTAFTYDGEINFRAGSYQLNSLKYAITDLETSLGGAGAFYVEVTIAK